MYLADDSLLVKCMCYSLLCVLLFNLLKHIYKQYNHTQTTNITTMQLHTAFVKIDKRDEAE